MTRPARLDCLILGAGAAGLFAAAHAAATGKAVRVIDHAMAPGEKIRISGGGRCNFTNMHAAPENFLSGNPHFAKSALARYTQWDFLDLVGRHGIAWHEKTLGQLFCDTSAKDIIAMLLAEMEAVGATLSLQTSLVDLGREESGFRATLEHDGRRETVQAATVVVATGGKSIPKMGASSLGYRIAADFGLPVTETRPALVPLTFSGEMLDRIKPLAGVGVAARVSCDGTAFEEGLLFTHRGLSGPSILQISSYWREGRAIRVSLSPGRSLADHLRARRASEGRKQVQTVLAEVLPQRVAGLLAETTGETGRLADLPDPRLAAVAAAAEDWEIKPTGSEGYRTAEVTLGGVDTDALSSKTMEARAVPGLYFIGEVVDVTGWLGGYNFQWAWSSAFAAGTAIAARQ